MSEQAYVRIAESVDRGFQTAPKAGGELSKAFIAYLKLLYKPEEAALIQHLEMLPNMRSAEQVAEASGEPVDRVEEVLASLVAIGFLTRSRGCTAFR